MDTIRDWIQTWIRNRGRTEPEGELEAQVDTNVRQWADKVRESERLNRLFQRLP